MLFLCELAFPSSDQTCQLNSQATIPKTFSASHSSFFSSTQSQSPSLSAREQVLRNEDLLYIIFSFFHSHLDRWTFRRLSSPPLSAPKSTLLPAALACKAFFLPVIRVLWFESSILSLLRIIPVLVRRGKTFVRDLSTSFNSLVCLFINPRFSMVS